MSASKPVVILRNEQAIAVDEARLVHVATLTASSLDAVGEISVTLVDPARMQELNERFMDARGPTDVLSFPIDGLQGPSTDLEPSQDHPPVLVGEVVICPSVAAARAKESFDSELDLLVAHGVLHLLGFDHDSKANAQRMAGLELKLTGRAGATF